MERELKKVQEKYRETMGQLQMQTQTREHLEVSLRKLEQDVRISQHQYEEQAALFRKERAEL